MKLFRQTENQDGVLSCCGSPIVQQSWVCFASLMWLQVVDMWLAVSVGENGRVVWVLCLLYFAMKGKPK